MAFPAPSAPRRELYPEIEPFDAGWMPTGTQHEVYYEQSGKADGKPVERSWGHLTVAYCSTRVFAWRLTWLAFGRSTSRSWL